MLTFGIKFCGFLSMGTLGVHRLLSAAVYLLFGTWMKVLSAFLMAGKPAVKVLKSTQSSTIRELIVIGCGNAF